MVYMFNELSLKKVSSIQAARDVLEKFVTSATSAAQIGFTEIRLYENNLPTLYQIPLSQAYNIDDWLKDPQVDSDLQDKFRQLVTAFPLITETEFKENEVYQRSEFYKVLDNTRHQVWGLGAAYIYDTISVSLETHIEWSNSNVEISHYYLNQKGEDITSEVIVRNFSNSDNLNVHLEWWEEIQKNSLQKSKELWERKNEFFPHLILCGNIEKQLEKIGVSKVLFQIIERLRELNDYAKDWETGSFNYDDVNLKTNLRISPESPSTIRKYGTLRKFSIEGQGKKLFDLHIKTGDLRFHLYPDNETQKIYIGYIGKHLRVASED